MFSFNKINILLNYFNRIFIYFNTNLYIINIDILDTFMIILTTNINNYILYIINR